MKLTTALRNTRTLILTPTFDLHTITLTSGEIAAITLLA